ncbi:MAG: phosphate ABC transporter substrate-binding protein, partial [Gammaproteobacteria bacterium]|nr:phosphate ABC transporter substrate-binding protein [Gammaproteobacteria bacterium]
KRTLIQNKGSDSMAIIIQSWAEKYREISPNTGVAVMGGGSRTGMAAIISGTTDIANSSRAVTAKELGYAKKRGVELIQYTVGHDAIAIYVHPNNPIKGLSFPQLAGIFGREGNLRRWTELGISVPECKNQEIVRVSRQNNSGTYAYFRKFVFRSKRGFKLGTREAQSSKDLVALIETTPCAIGYSSLAYATPGVKTVCTSQGGERPCITPSIASIVDHSYALARPLFMYTDGEPQGELKKYLDWVLSDAGQCLLLSKGYGSVRPVECGQ